MENTKENLFLNKIINAKVDFTPKFLSELLIYDQTFSFESSMGLTINEDYMRKKLSSFLLIKEAMLSYIDSKKIKPNVFFHNLWKFYLPYSLHLKNLHKINKKPFIQGILGVQGAGKTTFAEITTKILSSFGLKAANLSIDDIYKTYTDRKFIKKSDPRLKWRGPPGTHDIEIAIDLLEKIKNTGKGPFSFPSFDKSLFEGKGDRVGVKIVEDVDILLFEGWFLGMRPLDLSVFDNMVCGSGEDICFAKDMSEN